MVNFGRMPPGFRMSSGRNARLAKQGKQFRGGPTGKSNSSQLPGIAPVGSLDGDTGGPEWCGHRWSEWLPIREAALEASGDSYGLYRVRGIGRDALAYLGEGRLARRIRARARRAADLDHPQGEALAAEGDLESSWVIGNWPNHQRLELETDLIGSHLLVTSRIPVAQFLG